MLQGKYLLLLVWRRALMDQRGVEEEIRLWLLVSRSWDDVVQTVPQRRRRHAMGNRRQDIGRARRRGPRSSITIAICETLLARPPGMTRGARHASRTHVEASRAGSRAVLAAEASNSLCSALVASGAPDCGFEHGWCWCCALRECLFKRLETMNDEMGLVRTY